MKYRRFTVQHTSFRKLPKGARFWFGTDLPGSEGHVKYDNKTYLVGWSSVTGAPRLSTVADTSIDCVKVPWQFNVI